MTPSRKKTRSPQETLIVLAIVLILGLMFVFTGARPAGAVHRSPPPHRKRNRLPATEAPAPAPPRLLPAAARPPPPLAAAGLKWASSAPCR